MSHTMKSIGIVLLLAGLLIACAAPATTATIQPESTQSISTPALVPGNPSVQVSIPVGESTETLKGNISGNGNIAIIIANTLGNDPSRWVPLVEALGRNENLRIVTFAYRTDNEDTHVTDTIAVFGYLSAEHVDKIICIGAGFGSTACAGLQEKPEIIGMVFFATNAAAIDANFPKLFLTADADPFQLAGTTQRAYEQSAEPKSFKSYSSGRHGPSLLTDPIVGSKVLADVTDFINEIVSGQ